MTNHELSISPRNASDHEIASIPPQSSPWEKVLSPRTEINFVRDGFEFPEQLRQYFENSLNSTISEFVLKDRLTIVRETRFEDGKLKWGNHDLADSCMELAFREGLMSRSRAEWQGLMATNHYLTNAINGELVIAVSPPKVAAYGFLFVYQRGVSGDVNQRLIRYDEKMGELGRTHDLLKRLGINLSGEKTNDFVATATTIDADFDTLVDTALSQVTTPAELALQERRRFEIENHPKIRKWKSQYLDIMTQMAIYGENLADLDRANRLRDAILELSKSIIDTVTDVPTKQLSAKQSLQLILDDDLPDQVLQMRMAALAQFSQLSRSDCEVLTGEIALGMGFVGVPFFDFEEARKGGFSYFDYFHGVPRPESRTHYADYRCEGKDGKKGCGKWLTGEKIGDEKNWRKNCPHCNIEFACKTDKKDSEVYSIEGEVGGA